VDGFAYLPPEMEHVLATAGSSATLIVFERRYTIMGGNQAPELIVGSTDKQPLIEAPGEIFELRKLLPTNSIYDFNIHVMDFQPGEFLNVKEVHYNQHGLLLLEGQGIYRLADKWYVSPSASKALSTFQVCICCCLKVFCRSHSMNL
jgi:(S)-ureidoglycine aminohydrolase